MNLIFFIPSILATLSNNFANVSISPSPLYELTFCPKSVISKYPFCASSSTSFNISSAFLLLSLPLTYGTIQNVQKLLHPYIIVTLARSPSILFTGIPSYISPLMSITSNILFPSVNT